MTSRDGVEWISRCSPSQDDFSSIAFGNGQFVAVSPACGANACSGTIITSVDGINWVLRPHGPTAWGLNAVAFGNGQFVGVCGGASLIVSSTNGTSWVEHPSGTEANLTGVAFGQGQFVVVSDGGQILTSTNGANWVQRQSGTTADFEAFAYGGGEFVGTTGGGSANFAILASPDGVHWTQRWSANSSSTWSFCVGFGNGVWVAMGVDATNGYDAPLLLTWPDGINWVRQNPSSQPYYLSRMASVAWQNGQFVAVGGVGTVLTSPDGVNWSLTRDGSHQLLNSTNGPPVHAGNGPLDTWTTRYQLMPFTNPPTPGSFYGITYGNGQFIAVGDYGAVATSADGTMWATHQAGTSNMLTSVAYGNGLFVALVQAGFQSLITTSADGVHWTPLQLTSQRVFTIAYGNGLFVALGLASSGAVILTSKNGTAWSPQQSGAQNGFNAITYDNGQFLAVGGDAVRATSSDGTNWTVCQPWALDWLNGVAYGNGLFVAVGGRYIDGLINDNHSECAIITSPDGINWSLRQPQTTNVLTSIAYGDGQFVAVGDNGTLLSSADGVNWVRRQLGSRAFALTFGDGQFMALNYNGEILGSGSPGDGVGPLGLWIDTGFTNAAPGVVVPFTAWHSAVISRSVWDFGDGTVVTNQLTTSHAWTDNGLYRVRLTGFNDDFPAGDTMVLQVQISQPVYYVNPASSNPVPPYQTWDTAAQSIQDAIEAGSSPGRLVLVTNGVYQSGTVMASDGLSRVSLKNQVLVRSVNGPLVTVIEGDSSGVRCAHVGGGSVLSGFTLTNGAAIVVSSSGAGGGVVCDAYGIVTNCVLINNTAQNMGGGADSSTLYSCTLTGNSSFDGGGASGSTLYNCDLFGNLSQNNGGGADFSTLYSCTLTGNAAPSIGGWGGGASFSTLYNCVLTANWAGQYGGGAFAGNLYNCTLSANAAQIEGGGAYSDNDITDLLYLPGTLNNCIVYSNTAPYAANHSDNTLMNYCCTTPTPTNGIGNITSAPLFLDSAGVNLRLQSNSPCINAGNNCYAPAGPDLDGNPRIAGGTVDIGAYEFQTPASRISYAWLQNYGLQTDGSADFTDADGDGLNNWQEWRCGTDPTNALSALRMRAPILSETSVTLTWESIAGVNYFLLRVTDPAGPGSFAPIASAIQGQAGTTRYTDTRAANAGPFYYRVGVGN